VIRICALIDTGYYTHDGTSQNDWQKSHFTGKGGIEVDDVQIVPALAFPLARKCRRVR